MIMSYFTKLIEAEQRMTKKALKTLKGRPDKSMHDLCKEIWEKTWDVFTNEYNEDWDTVPEIIANICDGGYLGKTSAETGRCSLNVTMGFSVSAREVYLWQLHDYVFGVTTEFNGCNYIATTD